MTYSWKEASCKEFELRVRGPLANGYSIETIFQEMEKEMRESVSQYLIANIKITKKIE